MPKKEEEKLEEEIKEEEEILEEEEIKEKALEPPETDEGKGEKEEVEVSDTKVDDKPDELPKFTLSDTEEAPSEAEDEKIEIVHNGQVYKLTKDKIVELAQKGFDYDFKVGPHGKLAQMIDSDPELSKVVDDYWQGKVAGGEKFEVKPLDSYENEEEWLEDNLKRRFESTTKVPVQADPQPKNDRTMADDLRMRDPEFFDRIFPKLDEYAQNLSMKDYRKVDSDMGSLCQFYDFVKGQELAKPKKIRETETPGFRVKSGGGESPRADSVSPAWKLSKEDFQKQLDRVKGYS